MLKELFTKEITPSLTGRVRGGSLILLLIIATMSACKQDTKVIITRSDIQLASDTLTPEALWAMGRIGSYAVSPDGQRVA